VDWQGLHHQLQLGLVPMMSIWLAITAAAAWFFDDVRAVVLAVLFFFASLLVDYLKYSGE
jgi:hypothetical protein